MEQEKIHSTANEQNNISNNMENDFVENSQILPQEVEDFLKTVFAEIKLTSEQQHKFMQKVYDFSLKAKQKHEENSISKEQELQEKIKTYWGSNYSKNIVFFKRALKWLGINSLEDEQGIINFDFINKIVDLGKILSEDNNIGEGDNDLNLSASEAISLRNKITGSKDFSKIMFNKMHPSRKEIMEKLNYLNGIIAEKK